MKGIILASNMRINKSNAKLRLAAGCHHSYVCHSVSFTFPSGMSYKANQERPDRT